MKKKKDNEYDWNFFLLFFFNVASDRRLLSMPIEDLPSQFFAFLPSPRRPLIYSDKVALTVSEWAAVSGSKVKGSASGMRRLLLVTSILLTGWLTPSWRPRGRRGRGLAGSRMTVEDLLTLPRVAGVASRAVDSPVSSH